jgi:tripartite-type tricarboxylate transporter receptor subunit TctC
VPTFAEAGVRGVEATSWYGIAAPAGTPAEIVRRLAADVAKAVASADLKAKYVSEGVEPETNAPEAFAAFLRSEIARWGKAVKDAGITAD